MQSVIAVKFFIYFFLFDDFVKRTKEVLKISDDNVTHRDDIKLLVDEWVLLNELPYETVTLDEAYALEMIECKIMLAYYKEKNNEATLR